MDETIRISPCLSHKIIFHIGPHPWLVSGLLSSYIYGTYCNVYTVQCNVSTDRSFLFDYIDTVKVNSKTIKLLSILTLHCTVYTLQYVPCI